MFLTSSLLVTWFIAKSCFNLTIEQSKPDHISTDDILYHCVIKFVSLRLTERLISPGGVFWTTSIHFLKLQWCTVWDSLSLAYSRYSLQPVAGILQERFQKLLSGLAHCIAAQVELPQVRVGGPQCRSQWSTALVCETAVMESAKQMQELTTQTLFQLFKMTFAILLCYYFAALRCDVNTFKMYTLTPPVCSVCCWGRLWGASLLRLESCFRSGSVLSGRRRCWRVLRPAWHSSSSWGNSYSAWGK